MSTSRSERPRPPRQRAVALQYGVSDAAPVIVASGMGHLAEKILDVAQENGVPIYEDNSLATILSQLDLGQSIPEELYRAVVEIDHQGQSRRQDAPAPEQPAGEEAHTEEES